MSEESAVNYWEVRLPSFLDSLCALTILRAQKYGHVAFDTAQKAVLTSCVLRYKPSPASFSGPSSGTSTANPGGGGTGLTPTIAPTSSNKKRRRDGTLLQDGFINCCFSFTIQRDLHGIPTLISGMFFLLVKSLSVNRELIHLFLVGNFIRH